jgi:hypothetical protein
MWGAVAIGVLAFIAHAEDRATDPAADLAMSDVVKMANGEEFTDKFVDKLVNKLVEVDPNILAAVPRMIQSELDREADKGTAYEWIKYNSEVDPRLALEAEAAVAIMQERAALEAASHGGYDAPIPSSPAEQLVQTPTQSISLASLALMGFFMCSMVAFAARHLQRKASTEDAAQEASEKYIMLA